MKLKMAVVKDNVDKCMEKGVFGCSEGRGGINVLRLSEMLPGDKIVFYATGICKFAGIAEVTKSIYQDETKIWDNGVFPYRVKIKPIVYPKKDKWIDVRTLINDLDYFKNKIQWSMHFMQNLRPISEKDYKTIKKALETVK